MPELMRLLYVTAENWPTFRADVATLFGKYLPRLGIRSDLVTGRAPGAAVQAWGGGEAFLGDVSGSQVKKHLKTFLHIWRQLRAIDLSRYDAIQVRDLPLPATLALWVARRKGLPFFYWMSYPMPEGQLARARENGPLSGIRKFFFPWLRGQTGRFLLYKIVLPRADHVFVQSERMKQDMIALGVAAGKMTPVPMGVDLETMDLESIPPTDDPRLASRRVLAYLGTLDPPRRIEILFEMLALVQQSEPAALLVLVGDTHDSEHRAWLKSRSEQAGVAEHVVWTGWLPMREGWRYIREAEVGLSPFPRGFLLDSASPTKVAEYLALGIPVVCNDNPDQQALVEAAAVGRCTPYTADNFARAVLELLRMPADERDKMGKRGRKLVTQEREYRMLAAGLASHYREILKKLRMDTAEK
ncbi:MAG TPA: glycosyltransferase [Candidatus Desulfobacillus sp.]|nr:glycosyltransferase [Candidatus Desulfobacillus sp.]